MEELNINKSDSLKNDLQVRSAELDAKSDNREEAILSDYLTNVTKSMPDMSDEIHRELFDRHGRGLKGVQYVLSSKIIELFADSLWCPRFNEDPRADKQIHIYCRTHWVYTQTQFVFDYINVCCSTAGLDGMYLSDPKFMRNVYDRITFNSAKSNFVARPKGITMINLRNGTLEINENGEGKLREHRRDDYFTYSLPYAYDQNATCPRFMEFLSQILPNKEIHSLLQQFMGYVFTRDVRLEKMPLLYGGGSNGKSTLLAILSAALGEQNVSEVPLDELTNDEKKRYMIENRLLNISTESKRDIDTSVLKQIISGETIMAKHLYADAYPMTNYAKQIASFNRLPLAENTHGFYRRIIIIPFNVTISDEMQDMDLKDKLCEELPGILNWIIDGLKAFLKTKKLPNPQECKDALRRYMLSSDSVRLFVQDCCEKVDSYTSAASDILKKYNEYCKNGGLRALGRNTFYDRLGELGFTLTEYQRNKRFNIRLIDNE